MGSTLDLLIRLIRVEVEFVVVGGVAGVLHGSSLVTQDIDVCAPLTRENLARILSALRDLSPRFRMTPEKRALPEDVATLVGYRNLYLITDWGQIDILSEITGIGDYPEVARHAIHVSIGGADCRVLALDTLIQAKKALNLPKDRQAILELEAIRERLSRSRPNGTN
jgi:hypothetical protein